jgi:uncharacterized protein YqeY
MSEQTIREDLKVAMRERDSATSTVLRGLLAAIKNKTIELKIDALSEKDFIAVVKREAKQCSETLDFARKAGREESVAEHEAVLSVLERYLPAQMDEAGLRAAIEEIATALGDAPAMGAIMKELSAKHGGSYDGKTASRIAGEIAGGKAR